MYFLPANLKNGQKEMATLNNKFGSIIKFYNFVIAQSIIKFFKQLHFI